MVQLMKRFFNFKARNYSYVKHNPISDKESVLKVRQLPQLFISFLKIGFLAFGGGYAIIPLLQREIVESRQWISGEDLTEAMAISQTLPGIIFVNSATIIGYRVSGIWGAIAATVAAITPTFGLTLLITTSLWHYTDYPLVNKAFTGILLGVSTLIGVSLTKIWPISIQNRFELGMTLIATFLLVVFKINAALIILGVAAGGWLYQIRPVRQQRSR